MITLNVTETHNFTFFRILGSADFQKLPSMSEFVSGIEEIIEQATQKAVLNAEKNNRYDYDPINGYWDNDDQEWCNGWFEGNLDNVQDRSTYFPDPSPMQNNGSNGESRLCPRDLLNQPLISLDTEELDIKQLFLYSEDYAEEISNQIRRLFYRKFYGKAVVDIIAEYLSNTLDESENLTDKAEYLFNVIAEMAENGSK